VGTVFVLAITIYLHNEVKMNKFFRVFVLSLAMLAAFPVLSNAANIVGTEDSSTGFTGDIFKGNGGGQSLVVASDGESPFFPFNATSDQSDAVQFNFPGFTFTKISGNNWTQDPNDSTIWYLPAINENEPFGENVGKWQGDGFWSAGVLGTYVILSPDGVTWSDVITLANDGVNGQGTVTFASDPLPEPGSLTLLGLGVAGLVGYGLRRRMQRKATV
jgi:hypothetical protein